MKLIASLGAMFISVAAFAGPRCFVPNNAPDSTGKYYVAVFDQSKLNVPGAQPEIDVTPGTGGIDRIQVGTNPAKVAVTSDGRWAFGLNQGSADATWFSGRPDASAAYNVYPASLTAPYSISLGGNINDIVLAQKSDGNYRLYACGSSTLSVIEPHEDDSTTPPTYSVITKPAISIVGAGGYTGYGQCLCTYTTSNGNAALNKVYVGTYNSHGATINEYDPSDVYSARQVVTLPSVTVGGVTTYRFPFAIAISRDGSQIWVASNSSTNPSQCYVDVVNRSTSAITSYSLSGIAYSVALNNKIALDVKRKAYVAVNGSPGHVYSFNMDNLSASPTLITVGNNPWGLDVAPDGSSVWVANTADNNLSIIDTLTDTEQTNTTSLPRIAGATAMHFPVGVTFVPEDLRKFDTSDPASASGEQWPMFGGGAFRTGVARSPFKELGAKDAGNNLYGTSVGTLDSYTWNASSIPMEPYPANGGGTLNPSIITAGVSSPSDTLILATFAPHISGGGGVYAFSTVGNGSGQSLQRWTKALSGVQFISTPIVIPHLPTGATVPTGQYAVCISDIGDIYSINTATGQSYKSLQSIPTENLNGQTLHPFVISSPVRYLQYLYVAVGWEDTSNNDDQDIPYAMSFKDCGLVRIEADPSSIGTASYSPTVQIYFQPRPGGQPVQNLPYGSPALSLGGGTARIVFSALSSGNSASVYSVPVQSTPPASAAWTQNLSTGAGQIFEAGGPSIAYGNVFVGLSGTYNYSLNTLSEKDGASNGQALFMNGDQGCGLTHPPVAFDGELYVGSDVPYLGSYVYSFVADVNLPDNLLWGTAFNNYFDESAGITEYVAPILTTSGTLINQPYDVHTNGSKVIWGLDTLQGPNASDPSRAPFSLTLPENEPYGIPPTVVYTRNTNLELEGRWTFVVTGTGTSATLRSIRKKFQW